MSARQEVSSASDEEASGVANPAASKMPKLDKNWDDKENVMQHLPGPGETPLVTKMVRRFEQPPAGSAAAPPPLPPKPEVPKKPARLASQSSATPLPMAVSNTTTPTTPTSTKGVVRTDSVNDHGYFTLEKRKPVRMSVAGEDQQQQPQPATQSSPAPLDPPSGREDLIGDETDLRQNFEEFHLMDSLEEEEQQFQFQVFYHSHSFWFTLRNRRTGTIDI